MAAHYPHTLLQPTPTPWPYPPAAQLWEGRRGGEGRGKIVIHMLAVQSESRLTREAKALFFPVLAVVYPSSDDLFDEVLRVSALDGFSIFLRSIRHFHKTSYLRS